MKHSGKNGNRLFHAAVEAVRTIGVVRFAAIATFAVLVCGGQFGYPGVRAADKIGKGREAAGTQPTDGSRVTVAGLDDIDTCSCPTHGDPQTDGVVNIFDVIIAVNVAFKGVAPTSDPDCPTERTDVNCDGVTNGADVERFLNVAYRGSDPATEFCNPCDSLSSACEPTAPQSGSAILVESVTAAPGETGVQVGIYVDNAVDISLMTLPLELREVTAGSL